MTKYFSEDTSVEAVNSRMGKDINPRLATVIGSLVTHLHAFRERGGLDPG
jgi:hypothetical protein